MSVANFAVSTQDHVLLSNFSVTSAAVVKEFSLNVTSNDLVITFTPSANSIAFLNAIEVVSVPDALISDDAHTISPAGDFQGLLSMALETVWRVNMGGPTVTPNNDTLWRTWIPDQSFLVQPNAAKNASNIAAVNYVKGGATQDTAPQTVYGTATEMNSANNPNSNFNVSWEFDVDIGFEYLVRFHFCDIVSTSLNELYFNVYIDPWIVVHDLDLSTYLINELAAAYYMDYVTVTAVSNKLRVSVGPSTVKGAYPNAILNGLEIMKLNNSKGSLSAADAVINSSSKKNVGVMVGTIIGAFIALVLAGILFMLFRKRRRLARQRLSKTWIPISTNGGNSQSMVSKYSNGTTLSAISNIGYRIPFAAVQEATNNFDESWVIGIGGFGKVYKGVLSDGTKVAVKRGNPRSQQGLAEFQTEIEMLSQFRHRHLVSLIGYCDEGSEMILVYEFMEKGSLREHLYDSNENSSHRSAKRPTLTWKQRLEICIGAAKGLHYLHTCLHGGIIHRDVKSTNILLNEHYVAKVADFGLSRSGPDDPEHFSVGIKGSFGYVDPEYFRSFQFTDKSDVYSFGVVLLEVLCARPAIIDSPKREEVNLAEWGMLWQKKGGQLEKIMDPLLVGDINPDSLRKFGETAVGCLKENGAERPTMLDVLWDLEYALQLQKTAVQVPHGDSTTNAILGLHLTQNLGLLPDIILDEGGVECNEEPLRGDNGSDVSGVFSQIEIDGAR